MTCAHCGHDRFYCHSESTRPIVCAHCDQGQDVDSNAILTIAVVGKYEPPVSGLVDQLSYPNPQEKRR